MSIEIGVNWDYAYKFDQLDMISKYITLVDVLTKVYRLVTRHPDYVMSNLRKLGTVQLFFVDSLFMNIPGALSFHDIFSWNVMILFIRCCIQQR